MDPARPLLLGLLALGGACASWPQTHDAPPRLSPLAVATAHHADATAPDCGTAPELRVVGRTVVIHRACHEQVAVFRRDVVQALPPELIGLCTTPCVDERPHFGEVLAYTTRSVFIEPSSQEATLGATSPEAYIAVDPPSDGKFSQPSHKRHLR